jgi:hypothetical protein
VGSTEKSFIVMSQQVSMGENGYFPTANGGSFQYRVPTKSLQRFMECMENHSCSYVKEALLWISMLNIVSV